ncbi:A24 family peptidase [Noviherbaspirillum aerium]|uniref:A24 family peptidase n=1 Tax=Noviherbaspirillum aerium TaxID=2588497 RepID=UPI00124EE6C5|nr:prepilin peptidase [Noviherbaspirillum aerium]
MHQLTPALIADGVLFLLGAFLVAAVCSDLKSRRIPNKLVLAGIGAGCALNSVLPEGNGFLSALPGAAGIGAALAGLATGFCLMLPMYLLRALGAGDVKLFAMTGAFLGAEAMLPVVLATLIAGGALSLVVAIHADRLRRLADNLRTMLLASYFKLAMNEMPAFSAMPEPAGKMPYGVAIAAGTLICIAIRRGGVELPWFASVFQ